MAEILEICGRYYDLNEPLGIATKILVTGGLKKVIQIIKAKEKWGNQPHEGNEQQRKKAALKRC